MDKYQYQKEKEIELSNNNVLSVYNAIKSEVESLGLTIEIIDRDKWGEALIGRRGLIKHPKYPDFEVLILGQCWNEPEKASTSFNTQRVVNTAIKTDDNGVTLTNTERYEFDYMLKSEQLEAIGLKRIEYRYSPNQLSKTFKATKNPKLIIKDVIPALKIYLELIKLASPAIDAKIARENDALALQNRLYRHAEHYHGELKTLKQQSFTIPGVGRVEIDTFGNIELKRQVSESEIMEMLAESTKAAA